jgi:hypothetical protein
MTDPLIWPSFLAPAQILANPVPFSRSGGVSLGGLERTTRTDRGWWMIDYKSVALYTVARRRIWNAFRVSLSGASGSFVIPVWSFDTSPWAAGTVEGKSLTPHSDDSPFDDESLYEQPTIIVTMGVAAALGDTSVTLRIGYGIDELTGTRFSYNHALYELGIPTAVVDDLWTMPVFPAIRAAIPIDAALEFDLPTCRVRLASDREMDVSLTAGGFDRADVSFREDTAFWNDAAIS